MTEPLVYLTNSNSDASAGAYPAATADVLLAQDNGWAKAPAPDVEPPGPSADPYQLVWIVNAKAKVRGWYQRGIANVLLGNPTGGWVEADPPKSAVDQLPNPDVLPYHPFDAPSAGDITTDAGVSGTEGN